MDISKLQLKNIKTVHARAEDYCKEKREMFDFAVSRAVASLPTLSEYLLPYVRKGGKVLMYKASKAEDEIKDGEKAVKTLGGKIKKVETFSLSEVDSERKIIIIDKVSSTPLKYPRGKNLPKTKPIV